MRHLPPAQCQAHYHLAMGDDQAAGFIETLAGLGDIGAPNDFAGLGIQRIKPGIGSVDIDLVFVHREAAQGAVGACRQRTQPVFP